MGRQRTPVQVSDLRAGGAQEAKHSAKLFDVILPWEKGGPIQQLPQDPAHGTAHTEHKHLRDLSTATDLPAPALTPDTRVKTPTK